VLELKLSENFTVKSDVSQQYNIQIYNIYKTYRMYILLCLWAQKF